MIRLSALRIAGLCALTSLVACGETTSSVSPEADSETPLAIQELDAGTNRLLMAEFTGSYDSNTGEFTVTTVPQDQWAHRFPEAEELSTVTQALWCQQRPNAQQRLGTVAGSIGTTLAECGIPSNSITLGLGAFCADIQLSALVDLTRPVAQITDITSGYEGYSYFESAGLIGVNPSTLGGSNPPSALLGLFGWANTVEGATSRTTWAFHNAGGSFTFAGEIYAEVTEVCDAVDNDCDGEIDEGAGCVVEGGDCVEHADCETGSCVADVCGASTCDNLGVDGSETDVDCGGTCDGCADGLVCATGDDCVSGNCFLDACVANRYPEPGEVVVSEFMADGSATGSGNIDQEWVELYNRSGEDLRLEGCELRDSANGHTIATALVIPAEGFVVLAEEDNGSVGVPDYEWSGFGLNNGGDDIVLNCPIGGAAQTLIDEISYTGALADDQISGQLHNGQLTAAGNNVAANFCLGTDEYVTGYFGTPGAPNNSCDVVVDSCTFERPTLTSAPAAGSVTLYARVAAAGVTDLTTGTDVNAANGRFGGQIGYGPLGSDPATSGAWVWTDMVGSSTWTDTSAPGQDEYDGTVTAPATEGASYLVAARFTGNNGGDYTNCVGTGQLDIIEPALPPAAVGDLLITEFMPDPGNTQNGEWFEVLNTTGSPLELQGCALTGRFDRTTISSSVIIAAGDYAVFANNGDTTLNYGLPVDHVWTGSYGLGNGGDDIGIECDIDSTPTLIDEISYGGSDDTDSVSNQLDPAYYDVVENDSIDVFCKSTVNYGGDGNFGTPGAANPACFTIGWCRLQFPTDFTDSAVSTELDIYSRLYVAGVTDSSTFNNPQGLIVGEVGYGADGTDPDTDMSWIWTTAAAHSGYGGAEANNDEYVATMTGPASGGPYDVAYRFSGNGGISWTYCDTDAGAGSDGAEDGYQPANSANLTIAEALSVDWCGQVNGAAVADVTGDTYTYHGELYIDGFTINAGSENDPNVRAEFGYGPDGNDPNSTPGAWTWATAVFDSQQGNNDRFAYDLTIPGLDSAALDTGFRFSGDGGATWSYCDTNGLGATWDAPGSLQVDPWTIGYCTMHFPPSHTGAPTSTETFYGRTWAYHDADDSGTYSGIAEDGTARTAGGVFDSLPNLVAEFGYGDGGTNPTSDPSWVFASASGGDQGADIYNNDDEFSYTLSVPANGTYDTIYRVSGDNGATWTYCGTGNVYPINPAGALVSEGSAPIGNHLYYEPFTDQDGQGNVDGVQDTSEVDWTLSAPSAPIDTSGPDYCEVVGGQFQTKDFGPCVWTSPIIDISVADSAEIAVALAEVGSHETTDCQMVSYSVDGGAYQLISNFAGEGSASCTVYDDFGSLSITATEIVGDTLQVRVTTANNSNSEYINMDSVTVTAGPEVTGPVIPTPTATLPYIVDFAGQDGQGVTGSTSGHNEALATVNWTVDHSNAALTRTTDWCRVQSGRFEGRDTDGDGCGWLSEVVDVTGAGIIVWGGLATHSGYDTNNSDWTDFYISVDGGPWLLQANFMGEGNTSHTLINQFNTGGLPASFLTDVTGATTVQMKVTIRTNGGSDYGRLDDVIIAAGI